MILKGLDAVATWLLEAEISVLFFVGACFLALGPWIAAQYRRFGRLAGWPAVISAATIAYTGSLVAFTMFPLPSVAADFCTKRELYDYWRVVPGASFVEVAELAGDIGLAATLTSGTFLQVAFNVLFFVPLGFLLGHRWQVGFWRAALVGLGVSLLIETTQGTGVWGLYPCPYRVAEADDLITNTTGALVGWAIAKALNPRLPDPTPERIADPGPPGLPRRILGAAIDVLAFLVAVMGVATVASLIQDIAGSSRGDSPVVGETWFVAIRCAVIAMLFVVIPAMRKFRDWPGTGSVACGIADSRTGEPANWRALGIKALVRFGPVPFLGLGWLAFGLVDLACALIRRDRRTVSDLLSRTTLVTQEHMRAHVPEKLPVAAE